MCGVAAGACSGAINLHWAKGSNISDISAKFGAQSTLNGICGVLFAAIFARSMSSVSFIRLWSIYALLTACHVYANVRCMKLLALDYFNTKRMNIVGMQYLSKIKMFSSWSTPSLVPLHTPSLVSNSEPLFFGWNKNTNPPVPIKMGVPFATILSVSSSILSNIKKENYSIVHNKGCISILLSDGASPTQRAKSYFHALMLGKFIKDGDWKSPDADGKEPGDRVRAVEKMVEEHIDEAWDAFRSSAEGSGWDFGKTDLQTEGFEVQVM